MEGDVSNEIGNMMDALEGKNEGEVKPEPEVVQPKVEEPKVEDVKVEDKKEDEVIPEVKSDEPVIEDKDKIISDLRNQLEALSTIKKEDPVVKEDKVEPKVEPVKVEPLDFIGDLDIEDIVHDKDAFNKLLNSVFEKGVATAKDLSTEQVLRSIPDIVKSNISIQTTLKEASDKFYNENEDLKPFKKTVAAVFEEVSSKNPDKSLDDILAIVKDQSRDVLKLQRQAKKDDPLPKLPSKGSGKKADVHIPDISPMQNEIEAMNKTIH